MEYVPGSHAASALFAIGLGFDAVVRGLVIEIGMTIDEAELAASAALADHLVSA
jgi:hypothetical protein